MQGLTCVEFDRNARVESCYQKYLILGHLFGDREHRCQVEFCILCLIVYDSTTGIRKWAL